MVRGIEVFHSQISARLVIWWRDLEMTMTQHHQCFLINFCC